MITSRKLKIGDRESQVLSLLQDSALLSVSDIAKLLSLRPHVIRRCIDVLRRSGIIVPYTPINTAALGYTECQFTLSSFLFSEKGSRQFISTLIKNQRVCFVREYAAELAFCFWVKELSEAQDILNELLTASIHMHDRTFSVVTSFRGFGVSCSSDMKPSGYKFQRLSRAVSIDTLDHRILICISEKNCQSIAEISRATGIAASTVEYRRARLIKSGVLMEPRYAVPEHALDIHRFTVRVKASDLVRVREQILKNSQQLSFIVTFVELVGPWDFEVTIFCKHSFEINAHVDRLMMGVDRGLAHVTVIPSVRIHKIDNYPFR